MCFDTCMLFRACKTIKSDTNEFDTFQFLADRKRERGKGKGKKRKRSEWMPRSMQFPISSIHDS